MSFKSTKFGWRSGLWNLSDFARPVARYAAVRMKDTSVSVLFVTSFHLLMGICAAYLIWHEEYVAGTSLLVLKGVVDAIDGELARVRERPSYVGRYYDSMADCITTLLFCLALGESLNWPVILSLGACLVSMLQTTLSNFYGVLIRQGYGGDQHSRVDESVCPQPYPWDNPKLLRLLHQAYRLVYAWQDVLITKLHPANTRGHHISSFAYALSSVLGFGFQSLLFLLLAICGKMEYSFHLLLIVNNIVVILCFMLVKFACNKEVNHHECSIALDEA